MALEPQERGGIWRRLRRPSTRWSVLSLLVIGIVIGFAATVGTVVMVEVTGTDKFCGGACHSMQWVAKEHRASVHVQNHSGVRAGCHDCHIPKHYPELLWYKAKAGIKDAIGEMRGVIDATDTSTGSFVSFRLYEQVKCITAPGDNALWFMYEPVLMSKRSFNRLNKQQQDVLMNAGKKSEQFFNGASKKLDTDMVAAFKKNNVEVVNMTPAEFDAWVKVAQDSSYKRFSSEVSDGKKLIDEALAVK